MTVQAIPLRMQHPLVVTLLLTLRITSQVHRSSGHFTCSPLR